MDQQPTCVCTRSCSLHHQVIFGTTTFPNHIVQAMFPLHKRQPVHTAGDGVQVPGTDLHPWNPNGVDKVISLCIILSFNVLNLRDAENALGNCRIDKKIMGDTRDNKQTRRSSVRQQAHSRSLFPLKAAAQDLCFKFHVRAMCRFMCAVLPLAKLPSTCHLGLVRRRQPVNSQLPADAP